MNITRFIVTAVDRGETCNGKATVLGIFKTRDEAKEYVTNDIQRWVDDRAGCDVVCDFDKMSAEYRDEDDGCEWQIHEEIIEV